MNIKKLMKRLFRVSVLKTIFINWRSFPIRTAIKFPILVYRSTTLDMGGVISVINPRPFMIQIGVNGLGTNDARYERTKLFIRGELVFNGNARLCSGARISVAENAKLIFGKQLSITGNTQIIAQQKITVGDNCLFSWGSLVMDSDFHHIYDEQNRYLNKDEEIIIGDYVWVGCNCTILKGSQIPQGCVIAAGSTITKNLQEQNAIYAGIGANCKVVKNNITWKE